MAALQTTEEGGVLSWSCCSGFGGESFESLGARARLVTSLGARRWSTAVGRGLGGLAAGFLAALLSDLPTQNSRARGWADLQVGGLRLDPYR